METTTQQAHDDWRAFRVTGDAAAFGRLVKSLTDLVHAAALRVTQESAMAEDVTQAVFLLLAKKGRSLPAEVQPGPWCWRQAVRLASNAVRTESRRRNREQLYAAMNEPSDTQETWLALAPVLDEALAALPAADQEVIIGRYFERQDMASLGQRIGISAEAAQKRATRALERLRTLLRRRGVGTTAALLSYALKAETVSAAPASLATKCVKAAAPAIPAGKWPVVLSYLGTRSAAAGLAAGLLLAGLCGWQLDSAAREAERKNAALAAALSAASRAENPDNKQAPPKPARLPFAEILRQLADTHWQPDNLATKKRITWLMDQITTDRLPDTARWMLERKHFRERKSLLSDLWVSWLRRSPESCSDFWTDEIYALSDEGSWDRPWLEVISSFDRALRTGSDASRLDSWLQRRITAEPHQLHAPGWKALARALLNKRLSDDPTAAARLLTSLPPGPGRRRFLDETWRVGESGYRRTIPSPEAFEAFQNITDDALRHEAVGVLLESERMNNPSNRTALDWWLQLPDGERIAYAREVLSWSFIKDRENQFNQFGVLEVLQQIPEEKRAPLAVSRFVPRYSGWQGLEGQAASLGLPEAEQFRKVQQVQDFPARLTAASAVENPQLQARLLRGLYGIWHGQKPDEAEAWLKESNWPSETRALLRAAITPLSP